MKTRTGRIFTLIFGLIMIGFLAVAIIWGVKNWDTITNGIDQTSLYTNEDIENAYNDGYSAGGENEEFLQAQVESLRANTTELESQVMELQDKETVNLADILDLTGQISSLDGQIDSLNDIISAKNLTIEGLNEDIEELQAEILNLRQQLLGVFERQYNEGFDDGVGSIDVNVIYQEAYDTGYTAGYARQEHIYEQQELNINVVWDGTVDTTWYTADHQSLDSTFDNITGWYLIYKPSQLAGLAQLVNSGVNFEVETVGILNNLYLNDPNLNLLNFETLTSEQISSLNEWTSIGTLENNFKGTLYGGIHFVSGLYINNSSLNYAGLFGNIESSTIYNIGIKNSYINANTYVGALIGKSTDSIIYNCCSNSFVNGYFYVGGFVGYDNLSDYDNCYSTGKIKAKLDVGGFIGYTEDSTYNDINVIENIEVIDSTETYKANKVGGFAGRVAGLNLTNANINATISAPDYTGGCWTLTRNAVDRKIYAGIIAQSYGNLTIDNLTVLADLPTIDTEEYEDVYSSIWGYISATDSGGTPYNFNISEVTYNYENEVDSYIEFGQNITSTFDNTITSSLFKGHDFSTETVEATCGVTGLITYTCKNCGYSYIEVITALEHNYVEIERLEPTDSEQGYILYKCSLCNDQYYTYIPSLTVGSTGLVFTGLNSSGSVTTDEELIVSYMVGNNTTSSGNGYSGTDKIVVVPYTYNGKPVTHIGKYAFTGNIIKEIILTSNITTIGQNSFTTLGLKEINIPVNVSTIDRNGFYNLANLEEINVDPNNTSYSSINGVLFNKSQTEIICYPRALTGSYTIPDGVTTIKDRAFFSSSLTEVIIPDSVISIGIYTFKNTSLISLNIPASVTSISQSALGTNYNLINITVDPLNPNYSSCSDNRSLLSKNGTILYSYANGNTGTYYKIPDTVLTIQLEAFRNCKFLETIEMTNVQTIYRNVFSGCTALRTINIPISVTQILNNTSATNSIFNGCSAELTIYCSAESKPAGWGDYWNYIGTTETAITNWSVNNNEVRPLTINEFNYSINNNELTILSKKDSCTLNRYIISSSYVISGVEYPVVEIGNGTTAFDVNVLEIELPEGLRTIASKTFRQSLLESITIPASVINIGSYAFYDSALNTISFSGTNITTIANSTFADCESLTSIILPVSITNIESSAFASSGLTTLDFTNNNQLANIGSSAFTDCDNLTSIIFNNSIASGITLSDSVFYDCDNLASINFGKVKEIGAMAFAECTLLTTLDLSLNSIDTIYHDAFVFCSGITSIKLRITNILDENAFNGLDNLSTFEFIGNPPASVGLDVFYQCPDLTLIKVPNLSIYQNVTNLSQYASLMQVA